MAPVLDTANAMLLRRKYTALTVAVIYMVSCAASHAHAHCCHACHVSQVSHAPYLSRSLGCYAQIVGVMALAGGIRQIVLDANTYSLFANLG